MVFNRCGNRIFEVEADHRELLPDNIHLKAAPSSIMKAIKIVRMEALICSLVIFCAPFPFLSFVWLTKQILWDVNWKAHHDAEGNKDCGRMKRARKGV